MLRHLRSALLVLAVVLFVPVAWQVRASTTDGVHASVIASGGGVSANGDLQLFGSAGQPFAGSSTNGALQVQSGFLPSAAGPVGTAVDELPGAGLSTRLIGARPNPFNPRTEVRFELAEESRVLVEVHDVRGRLIRTLIDDHRPAGPQSVIWDGADRNGRRVASGTYYLRLSAGGRIDTQKVSLLK